MEWPETIMANHPFTERWLGVDAPGPRRNSWPAASYAWALFFVALCTLVDQILFNRMAETNLILVYLLGILPVALRGDAGAAILAAVLSVGAFDFFFVHPYLTFAVSDTQYLFTFFVMGLVGTVISTLTSRLVSQLLATRQRERRARALFELSRTLLSLQDPKDVLSQGARLIGVELGQPVSAWLKDERGEPQRLLGECSLGPEEDAILLELMAEDGVAQLRSDMLAESGLLVLPVRSARRVHGIMASRWKEQAGARSEVLATLQTSANLLAIALDEVLARKEASVALSQAEVERMRSALLSSVSHDLRTPLTGIVGAASSLEDGAEALAPDIRRELAHGIVEEGERLNRLVTNLLNVTRLDAGGVQLEATWFPLEEVLAPALTRLSSLLAAHPVDLDLAADLPLVFADPSLIEQVVVNLLENAAKHTPWGTRVCVRASADEANLWVEIADEGPGLPPGEEERVFEKFRRFPRAGEPAGSGLGLAICRGVMIAHGGTMTAFNRPSGGATFRLSLPLKPSTGGPYPPSWGTDHV